jgi:hypothetical protein
MSDTQKNNKKGREAGLHSGENYTNIVQKTEKIRLKLILNCAT